MMRPLRSDGKRSIIGAMRRSPRHLFAAALLLALPSCGAPPEAPPEAASAADPPVGETAAGATAHATPDASVPASETSSPASDIVSGPEWEPPAAREPDTFRSADRVPTPICEQLWSGQLVGDEADELLCTRSNVLTVYGADGDGFRPRLQITGTGLPNAAWVGDRDGDGLDEFLIAFGMGRGFATAPVKVIELDAEEGGVGWWVRTLFEYSGPRPQVTALQGPELFLAHFESKYEVRSGFLRAGELAPDARVLRMAMSQVPADVDGDGVAELAVGRMYGDEPKSDGDLAVLHDGAREPVPTVRGIRTLLGSDLDGDGRDELLFGDGWHFRYRAEGEGRLNVAARDGEGGTWRTSLIHRLPGEFTVMRIQVRDVDGDGRGEVFAAGNSTLYRYDLAGDPLDGTWTAKELGPSGTGGAFTAVRRADGSIQLLTATEPPAWLDP